MKQNTELVDEVHPDCGRRLLPAVIDEIAQDDPSRPWASLPVDDWDLSLGFEDIDYAKLASAINKLAHFIVDHVGRSAPGEFETILYLGVPDIRYHILQMAVCKTGHKALFSSQLNTLETHLSLMKKTQCSIVLSAVGVHVRDIIAGREDEILHFLIPELDDLLDSGTPGRPFPYTKTYAEAARDPVFVLHSSGTTGEPKPVTVTHAAFAAVDRYKLLASRRGAGGRAFVLEWASPGVGVRGLMVTPPYHASSAYTGLVRTVFGGGVFLPGFRHRAVLPPDICGILEHSRCTNAILTPWMMEDVAHRPDADHFMKKLNWVGFGGAVLSPFAANAWSKHCQIQNMWGTTESALVPQLLAESEEFEYCAFDPDVSGVKFVDADAEMLDEDGSATRLWELVLTVTPESAPCSFWAHSRGLVSPFDSRPVDDSSSNVEAGVGDLWIPHPDPAKAKFLWRFAGRTDDLITFSTGTNMYTVPMQMAFGASPAVQGALVFGAGRLQPILLIELAEGVRQDEGLAQQLWDEIIQRQNSKTPTYARIQQTHILFVPHGGFVRTAKGSPRRQETERKYSGAIEEVYSRSGNQWRGNRERYGSVVVDRSFSLSASSEAAES